MIPLLSIERRALREAHVPTVPFPTSVNGLLLNAVLRRQITISNLQEQTGRSIVSLYLQAARETSAALMAASRRGLEAARFSQVLRAQRVRELMGTIRPIVRRLDAATRAELNEVLRALSRAEHATGANLLGSAIPPELQAVGVSIVRPPIHLLDVGNAEVLGRSLDRWGRRLTGNTLDELARTLNIGLLQGEDMSQLVARTARMFKVARIAARATARTAVLTVSAQTNAQAWDANRDILKGVQFTATFDDRVCPVCTSLDGNLYRFKGSPNYDRRPQIPIHPN